MPKKLPVLYSHKLLPQLFDIFTQIYLSYLWHYATLWSMFPSYCLFIGNDLRYKDNLDNIIFSFLLLDKQTNNITNCQFKWNYDYCHQPEVPPEAENLSNWFQICKFVSTNSKFLASIQFTVEIISIMFLPNVARILYS